MDKRYTWTSKDLKRIRAQFNTAVVSQVNMTNWEIKLINLIKAEKRAGKIRLLQDLKKPVNSFDKFEKKYRTKFKKWTNKDQKELLIEHLIQKLKWSYNNQVMRANRNIWEITLYNLETAMKWR